MHYYCRWGSSSANALVADYDLRDPTLAGALRSMGTMARVVAVTLMELHGDAHESCLRVTREPLQLEGQVFPENLHRSAVRRWIQRLGGPVPVERVQVVLELLAGVLAGGDDDLLWLLRLGDTRFMSGKKVN